MKRIAFGFFALALLVSCATVCPKTRLDLYDGDEPGTTKVVAKCVGPKSEVILVEWQTDEFDLCSSCPCDASPVPVAPEPEPAEVPK